MIDVNLQSEFWTNESVWGTCPSLFPGFNCKLLIVLFLNCYLWYFFCHLICSALSTLWYCWRDHETSFSWNRDQFDLWSMLYMHKLNVLFRVHKFYSIPCVRYYASYRWFLFLLRAIVEFYVQFLTKFFFEFWFCFSYTLLSQCWLNSFRVLIITNILS